MRPVLPNLLMNVKDIWQLRKIEFTGAPCTQSSEQTQLLCALEGAIKARGIVELQLRAWWDQAKQRASGPDAVLLDWCWRWKVVVQQSWQMFQRRLKEVPHA
jgi:hypothetical protein